MLKSIVREALLTSVTCCAPPVSFQISQVSMVPKASSRPRRASRAPGTWSSSQRILLAEKYASMSRPVFCWMSRGRRRRAFSCSQNSAVRRSCQTIAWWIGSPVSRSQTTVVSRWLVMPMAAMSRASSPARLSASTATPICEAQISCGVVLDPAGVRKDLRELLLGDRLDAAVVVEHDGARAGRALIEREDVGHGGESTMTPVQRRPHVDATCSARCSRSFSARSS